MHSAGVYCRKHGVRGCLAAAASLTLASALAVGYPCAQTLRLVLGETGVSFEAPAHCHLREGPGTAEAVCDPDGSPDQSRLLPAATALYFEVSVQPFAAPDERLSPEAVSQRYAFADFQKDLPGAVCGEERISRIKIESPQRTIADGRVMYSATVTCPEIKFLGLPPRRAVVRYSIGGGLRVNVLARALGEDFERSRPLIDAFFASLTLNPERKP